MAVLRRFVVCLVGATAVLAADKCYYPNGKLVTGTAWEACSGSDSCCNTGDTCLPGGLCAQPSKNVYRGACTDKLWGNDCASRCSEVSKTTMALLQKCATNKYCCKAASGDCCKDSSNVFGVQVDVASTSAKTTPTSSAKKTSSASSTSQSSTSSEASSSSTGAPVATDTPLASAAPSPQPAPAESSGGASSELKVGLGAGIGGGIAVVALIAGLAWYKAVRSRKQHDDNFQLLTPSSPSQVQLTQLRHDGASPSYPPPGSGPSGYFTREKGTYPNTYPGT